MVHQNINCHIQVVMNNLSMFAASLQIYRTWKSGKNQGYFAWLTNRTAPQMIALESCSNPQDLASLQWKNIIGFGIMFFC